MKCVSLKQPSTFLLSTGQKTIELRKWTTKFRDEFLIHASKNIDLVNYRRLKIDKSKLITDALIGSVFLYDVKNMKINKYLSTIVRNILQLKIDI